MRSETFERARLFMYYNARPLDMARFQYHFEGGSAESVMNVLSSYQNADGGFGHAVEADCWNPHSIPLHANTAGDIIREIGWTDSAHPVIQRLLAWYESGAHFDGHHWAITAPSSNDYPHAPWWHTDSESSCHTDYNGTAQIAGFILRYAQPDTPLFALGMRVADEAIAALSAEDIRDMHTATCYVRLMEYIDQAKLGDRLPLALLREKLHRSVKRLIVSDRSKWNAYLCKPSQFFCSRDSEFYPENRELAEYECEFIQKTQLADGSWDIPWRWDAFPDEWAISKNWWKGSCIVLNLNYLKGFGRL